MVGVFCFDQSSNHGQYPEDALRVQWLNSKDGSKRVDRRPVELSRKGWYWETVTVEGQEKKVKKEQEMNILLNGRWQRKGMKTILTEQHGVNWKNSSGMLINDLHMDFKACIVPLKTADAVSAA